MRKYFITLALLIVVAAAHGQNIYWNVYGGTCTDVFNSITVLPTVTASQWVRGANTCTSNTTGFSATGFNQPNLPTAVLSNHYVEATLTETAGSFFELDTFNTREKQHLSVPDVVFVTSEWAKSVVLNNDITTPVEVIPLGVDTNIFQYDKFPRVNNKDKYIFLNIGKWEVRKGHDILFSLFEQAFPDETDVELWILASEKTNGYSTPEQLSEWKKLYSSDDRIKISSGVDSHDEIARIMSNVDCGIFPSRAEGWNLELLEMMAMNKPVIATKYSAHTEFCNTDNCHLIDIDETEIAVDGKAFYGQGNWAKLGQNQFDQTIEYMRNMYKNRITTNPEGLKTAQAFSWKNSASKILGCIE